MRRHTVGQLSVIGLAAIASLAAVGSSAGATDYPPNETTPTTVVDYPPGETTPTTVVVAPTVSVPNDVDVLPPVGPQVSTTTAVTETSSATAGILPSTGSDSDAVVKVAAGAALAGVGLVAVARRRRRVTPTA